MYSYQREFPTGNTEQEILKGIVKLIGEWDISVERMKMFTAGEYKAGRNTFINQFSRMLWDDEQKSLVNNVYAPNYKTAYGFFGNMVSQKNNALYGETPTIKKMEAIERKKLGFALKSAGDIASTFGYAPIYEKVDGTYKVLDPLSCLIFKDDITKAIVKVVRYWRETLDTQSYLYFEIYDEEGITTYVQKPNAKNIDLFIEKQYYKVVKQTSRLSKSIENVKLSKLPIVIYKNNEDCVGDLKPNVKMKIDLIDLIQSGFANNIEEFSDVWMSICVPGATEKEVQQIKETARRTKSVLFGGSDQKNSVDFKTLEIPYQARKMAVDMLKEELVEDTGVIDFKQISGSATATEINARTYKLKQIVSDFEWFSDQVATELVEIWQEYHNSLFDIDITFNKLFISNTAEIINNANSVYGRISTRSYLKQLQIAGIIDDVEEELKEMGKDDFNKFQLEGDNDNDANESTQTNGQDNNNNGQDGEINLSTSI